MPPGKLPTRRLSASQRLPTKGASHYLTTHPPERHERQTGSRARAKCSATDRPPRNKRTASAAGARTRRTEEPTSPAESVIRSEPESDGFGRALTDCLTASAYRRLTAQNSYNKAVGAATVAAVAEQVLSELKESHFPIPCCIKKNTAGGQYLFLLMPSCHGLSIFVEC